MKKFSLLLLVFPFWIWSQNTSDDEPPVLEVGFSVFPLDSGDWEGIYYAPNGDPGDGRVELHFNPNERSVTHEYKGHPVLRFFRMAQDEEGTPVPQTVGTVNLNGLEANSKLILFFEPDSSGNRFNISPMLDSDENFPNESIVFFNTMNVPFIGILNDRRLVLNPGKSGPVSVADFLDRDVPIALAIRDDEDIHLVANNNIRFFQDRRTLLILRPPRRPGSLRIRTQRLTEFTGDRAEDPPEDPESP